MPKFIRSFDDGLTSQEIKRIAVFDRPGTLTRVYPDLDLIEYHDGLKWCEIRFTKIIGRAPRYDLRPVD